MIHPDSYCQQVIPHVSRLSKPMRFKDALVQRIILHLIVCSPTYRSNQRLVLPSQVYKNIVDDQSVTGNVDGYVSVEPGLHDRSELFTVYT